MRELGYVEGKDFVSEWRSVEGNYERFPELADELARLKVDVIVSGVTAALPALKRATTTIPIVMAYSDRSSRNRRCREPRASWRQHHRTGELVR